METLITYIPKCTFVNGAYAITATFEVYYRSGDIGKWASLSPKEESIVPINPIGYGSTAVYLTETGALSHPHWIREYDNEGYQKLHPIWDIIVDFPDMVDLTIHSYCPVTIIDGRLVEVGKNSTRLYTPYSTKVEEWGSNAEIALQAMKSPNPDAAVQLLGLVMSINKKCWDRHWLNGSHWELLGLLSKVRDNPKAPIRHTMYGDACITATQMADLRLLQKQSNGWWTYNPDNKTYYFAVNN